MKDYPNSTYQFNDEKLFGKLGAKLGTNFKSNISHRGLSDEEERSYDTGAYTKGVAWNDLTAESSPQYADNIKYLNLVSAEEYSATIEAFTYPDDFEAFSPTARIVSPAKSATSESTDQRNRNGHR
jgi:hypothetical protein